MEITGTDRGADSNGGSQSNRTNEVASIRMTPKIMDFNALNKKKIDNSPGKEIREQMLSKV